MPGLAGSGYLMRQVSLNQKRAFAGHAWSQEQHVIGMAAGIGIGLVTIKKLPGCVKPNGRNLD